VVANFSSHNVSVLRNISTIDFASFEPKIDYDAGSSTSSVALGDVNGDGKPDIVASNQGSDNISVMRNMSTSGTVSFAARLNMQTGNGPSSLSLGDWDGDGKIDLATVNSSGNNVSVLRNSRVNDEISFPSVKSYPTGKSPHGMAIGDVNGDGKPDLVVANFDSNTISFLRSRVMPSPTITSCTPDTATLGDTITFSGTYLTEPLAVDFDTVAAASFTGISDTSMTAVVGKGASGTIRITTPGGEAIYPGFHYLLPQTITFDSIGPQTYGDPDFVLNATASSSLDVTYTISDTTVATLISDTVHIQGAGSCTIYADQPGDTTYASAKQVTGILLVNTKPAEVVGVTAANKVYDGTATAELTGDSLTGILNTDSVTLITGIGTFSDKNIGTGKTVTATGYALAGPDSGNYDLMQPDSLTADITAATLAITYATANDKVYDGTTHTTLTADTLAGIMGTDDVYLTNGTGEFADKNVGTGKEVTATGFTISGRDSINYVLAGLPTGLSADITPAPLTIKADSGQAKIVGEADPVFTYSFPNDSLVEGDSITGALTRTQGETAGNYPIEIGTITAGDNYEITFISADFIIKTATGVADISANAPGVFPNPTKGLVTLNVEDGSVTITNLAGTVLAEKTLSTKKTIDLKGYAPGVYILILKTKDAVYKYKIIKQ
jgi:hypothetical protein